MLGLKITKWDLDDTAVRTEFPQILQHSILFNCILAQPGAPVFLDKTSVAQPRLLRVVADIACDPNSDYNPLPIYTQATDWDKPAQRIAKTPVLDVMAIDNLPSLLPCESSEDFAQQLQPYLEQLLSETQMKIAFGGAPKKHIAAILHSFEKRHEAAPPECACTSYKSV